MTGGLGYDVPSAARIYGAYTFLVYFTPIIGGEIADKFFRTEKINYAWGSSNDFR